MDEEELQQPDKKLSSDSFFNSLQRVEFTANRALQTSTANLALAKQNTNFIKALESGFTQLQTEVQQITNYIIIDQADTKRNLDRRTRNLDRLEDSKQKGIDSQQKGLEDDKPFSTGNKLLDGLASSANQFLRNNADLLVGGAISMIPFSRGRLVPGSGDSDTVKGLLTPGEYVIPKDVVKEMSPKFFDGLIAASNTKEENPYGVDPNSVDFNILAAIAALEGGDGQSRVDVAQSIYNRFADVKRDLSDGTADNAVFDFTRSSFKADESGNFPELSLADILLKKGQYQPAFDDPTGTEGTISPEFLNITDKDSAILAMKSYFDKRGDTRTLEEIEALFNQTVKDLQNKKLIEAAQEHVGGRTEFLGGEVEGDDVVDRGDGTGSDAHNAFFSQFGSGDQLEAGAAKSPLINLIEKTVDKIRPQVDNKDLSQENLGLDEETSIVLPSIDNNESNVAESLPVTTVTSPTMIGDNPLVDTASFVPFIEVISNHYLSLA
tara:strand:+ start:1935 stop:3416 length:1482 start_codon:yes stop_codon:yes gene_type:complete